MPFSRVPLPLPVILERLKLPTESATVTEILPRISVWRQLVQEYRPMAQSLEWELADLHWTQEGVFPFIDSQVPYTVNNNGRLSADAAALLFQNCMETGAFQGPIRLLELGAGTGLFARYFLDEFQVLCKRESQSFYERLTYQLTDRSPQAIQQWQERGIFQDHAGHAVPLVLDATAPQPAITAPVRAVICNYVLDVLPSAILRKGQQGWERLCVRTWITDDENLLRQYTRLTFDEIRALAASGDRRPLLPLLPLLEFEKDFQPAGPEEPESLESLNSEPAGAVLAYNYGAFACLDATLPHLEPHGFVLVNDYGPTRVEDVPRIGAQRFGPSTAVGLNFPLFEEHFRGRAIDVLKAPGDDERRIHTRLLLRGKLKETRRVLDDRFAAAVHQQAEATVDQARGNVANGRVREALDSYRTAIERNPRDWQLIGEAAEFVGKQLRDRSAALALARQAVELNPWYSPWVWNVLGDCLASLERPEEAHECYLQAYRVRPGDVKTNLNLANSWLMQGDPRSSLEAVARGLANDKDSMFRHPLLEKQQQAIAALSIRWNMERAVAARR